MANVGFLSPGTSEIVLAAHIEVLTRASAKTGVVNGNAITPTEPESMDLTVDAGRIRIAGTPDDVDLGTVSISSSHATLSRIDIIYRDVAGAVQVAAGAAAAIEDLKGLGNWRQYTSPAPPASIPPGAILGAVFVLAGVEAISAADIWEFAGPVDDLILAATNPGVDSAPLSEKAAVATFVKVAEKGAASGVATLSAGALVNQDPASKGQASGVASLNASSKVVEDPANATETPTASKIPIADETGKLADGWIPEIEAGSAFWTDMPGTPTRASDSQFTITDAGNANLYDKMVPKGTILKWEKSGGGFQTAMVILAAYAADAVTIDICGNDLAAGFTDMKFCMLPAEEDTFIVPGTLPGNTATTDIGKTIYAKQDLLIFGAQVRYKTAPTTTKGVWDINDDATSIFTTKPEIAASATLGVIQLCDCVLDTATTVVAKDSAITLDYDSGHATTPGANAYVTIWWMPECWRYRA